MTSLDRETHSCRPEPVEGPSLFLRREKGEGQGFEKLSPNGLAEARA
jgi:hypothetical protein